MIELPEGLFWKCNILDCSRWWCRPEPPGRSIEGFFTTTLDIKLLSWIRAPTHTLVEQAAATYPTMSLAEMVLYFRFEGTLENNTKQRLRQSGFMQQTW